MKVLASVRVISSYWIERDGERTMTWRDKFGTSAGRGKSCSAQVIGSTAT